MDGIMVLGITCLSLLHQIGRTNSIFRLISMGFGKMIDNKVVFTSIDEINKVISDRFIDSRFENAVAGFLSASAKDVAWQCVELMLTNDSSKIRSLGLRVVRRAVRDKTLLENVVWLSFNVSRL